MNSNFDKKLEVYSQYLPPDTRDALVFVVDTLSLCDAAAESLWEGKATPEHALEIFDRVMQQHGKGRLPSQPELLPQPVLPPQPIGQPQTVFRQHPDDHRLLVLPPQPVDQSQTVFRQPPADRRQIVLKPQPKKSYLDELLNPDR